MLGEKIKSVYPSFDLEGFKQDTKAVPGRYTEQVTAVAQALKKYLPDYPEALNVFGRALGKSLGSMAVMYTDGAKYAPLGKYVELWGPEHEGCFKETMEFIKELTKRWTGEFAMRPFLVRFLERCIPVLEEWSRDKDPCVRRCASECMRVGLPWAKKITFALDNWEDYRRILLGMAGDKYEYVRRSVANNVNEMFKADPKKAEILLDGLPENLKGHDSRWIRKHRPGRG